jgi:hypothetical protein
LYVFDFFGLLHSGFFLPQPHAFISACFFMRI